MPELLVSCQEISKAFGAAPLFEGLSFGVFEGDHVGLVGPNGSGKSTLLKILAGIEEPSSGTRAARKRLRIGYVPQDPVFDPEATVASVLRDALRDLHLDEHEIEGKIAVAMGKAGFADGGAGDRHPLRRLEEAPRRSRASWWASRSCCSSTSPRTTSTWTASCGSRSSCLASPRPSWR